MKTTLYTILLFLETVVDFLAMSIVWSNGGWIPCVLILMIWAVLLSRQIILLKKSDNEKIKRKIRRNIAFVMLVPFLGFIILFIWLIIELSRFV